MNAWIPVPVGERRQWIHEVRAESRIECYILASTQGVDGPWSYVLFVLDPARPEILTAYFARVHAEALEGGFNPLNGGEGISLTEEEGRDLSDLLERQIDKLTNVQEMVTPTFRLLKRDEYADLHLFSIASSYNALDEAFYRQLQPHGVMKDDEIVAILSFSQGRVSRRGRVFFQAMQFRKGELDKPDFRPNDYALPRIYLDRNDIRALVALFREHLR